MDLLWNISNLVASSTAAVFFIAPNMLQVIKALWCKLLISSWVTAFLINIIIVSWFFLVFHGAITICSQGVMKLPITDYCCKSIIFCKYALRIFGLIEEYAAEECKEWSWERMHSFYYIWQVKITMKLIWNVCLASCAYGDRFF